MFLLFLFLCYTCKKRDKFISPLKLWRYRDCRKSGASPGAPLSRTFGRELSRVAEISFVTVTIGERCAWRIVSDRRHDLTVDLWRWLHTDERDGPRSAFVRWYRVSVVRRVRQEQAGHVCFVTRTWETNDGWMMAIYRFHDIDLARPPRASRPVPPSPAASESINSQTGRSLPLADAIPWWTIQAAWAFSQRNKWRRSAHPRRIVTNSSY